MFSNIPLRHLICGMIQNGPLNDANFLLKKYCGRVSTLLRHIRAVYFKLNILIKS